MSNTSKKIFTPLSIMLIFCQLFLLGNFALQALPAGAEEETTPPLTEETREPAAPETINPEPTAPEPTSEEQPAGETQTVNPAETETPAPSDIETPNTETPVLPEQSENEPADETPTVSPETNTGGPASTSLSLESDPPANQNPEPLVCTEESPVFVIGGQTSAPTEPISLNMESLPLSGPRVLSLWAMEADKNENHEYLGTDNDTASGAQFLPSSQYQVNKTVAICALVLSENTTATVSASLSYPVNIATSTAPLACDQKLNPALPLSALESSTARELFCGQIKNSNNNLPTFYDTLNFDTLCAPDSALMAGKAQIYCAEQNLAYNDPAGEYSLDVSATDSAGRLSPILSGSLKYLELTAYAVDFNNISYGPVQVHTPKVIEGDTTWDTPLAENPATVSNVGNTRLRLVVKQNDFGLGKTGANWNVNYSAKIGDSPFVTYSPDTPTALAKIMELGETNSLTFSIYVFDFPTDSTASYAGEMFLTAEKADFLTCQ
ncbi:MAG TPA: hypothetical protein PLR18_02015 [bacterium]|nr:hypothetical protein [bacterium]